MLSPDNPLDMLLLFETLNRFHQLPLNLVQHPAIPGDGGGDTGSRSGRVLRLQLQLEIASFNQRSPAGGYVVRGSHTYITD